LDQIGVTQLWQVQPGLTGVGVPVVMAEASHSDETPPGSGVWVSRNDFEVSSSVTKGIPTTYINSEGLVATTFPNTIGVESVHADAVGENFFGAVGPAPDVSQIANIEADYFLNHFMAAGNAAPARIVNMSFIVPLDDPTMQPLYEQVMDNYVVQRGMILVAASGGMSGEIYFPGSAMNAIAVGAYTALVTQGPTVDGRSKPDLVAPADAASYAAPQVSAISALLVQAGTANMGGASTATSAVDARTIKVLLLSGAVKPAGWTNTDTSPLDTRFGAGIVNAYGSYTILAAGQKPATTTTHTSSLGGAHDAINTGTSQERAGWNLGVITNEANNRTDAVSHYLLNLASMGGSAFTATLTWYHPVSQSVANGDANYTISGLNNLDLFLYDAATNTRIAASTSLVDNLEHVFVQALPGGQYDLQVLKHGGGPGNSDWVSVSEEYALAWRATLQGDANMDGAVDAFDLNTVAASWQAGGKLWTDGDFTGDGVVNAFDLNALAANWQGGSLTGLAAAMEAYPAFSTTTVPEPASVLVLGVTGAGLMARRRRRRVS
jgi:hypothetical protein